MRTVRSNASPHSILVANQNTPDAVAPGTVDKAVAAPIAGRGIPIAAVRRRIAITAVDGASVTSPVAVSPTGMAVAIAPGVAIASGAAIAVACRAALEPTNIPR